MKLKQNADLPAFLKKVRGCAGEVWFVTQEGDKLNLKSVLSEYLFLSAAISFRLTESGRVAFENQEDAEQVRDFLEE